MHAVPHIKQVAFRLRLYRTAFKTSNFKFNTSKNCKSFLQFSQTDIALNSPIYVITYYIIQLQIRNQSQVNFHTKWRTGVPVYQCTVSHLISGEKTL